MIDARRRSKDESVWPGVSAFLLVGDEERTLSK
jgi:hypothetical protein